MSWEFAFRILCWGELRISIYPTQSTLHACVTVWLGINFCKIFITLEYSTWQFSLEEKPCVKYIKSSLKHAVAREHNTHVKYLWWFDDNDRFLLLICFSCVNNRKKAFSLDGVYMFLEWNGESGHKKQKQVFNLKKEAKVRLLRRTGFYKNICHFEKKIKWNIFWFGFLKIDWFFFESLSFLLSLFWKKSLYDFFSR